MRVVGTFFRKNGDFECRITKNVSGDIFIFTGTITFKVKEVYIYTSRDPNHGIDIIYGPFDSDMGMNYSVINMTKYPLGFEGLEQLKATGRLCRL